MQKRANEVQPLRISIFWANLKIFITTQQCRSEEHQEVAGQAQTLEEVEVAEAVVLEVVEVSNPEIFYMQILIESTGRGGFQQRDNGPPSDVFGKT